MPAVDDPTYRLEENRCAALAINPGRNEHYSRFVLGS
jgi:hypothetical protein